MFSIQLAILINYIISSTSSTSSFNRQGNSGLCTKYQTQTMSNQLEHTMLVFLRYINHHKA